MQQEDIEAPKIVASVTQAPTAQPFNPEKTIDFTEAQNKLTEQIKQQEYKTAEAALQKMRETNSVESNLKQYPIYINRNMESQAIAVLDMVVEGIQKSATIDPKTKTDILFQVIEYYKKHGQEEKAKEAFKIAAAIEQTNEQHFVEADKKSQENISNQMDHFKQTFGSVGEADNSGEQKTEEPPAQLSNAA
jgi:tetratricopeptide (TPR) repeat protein